MMPNPQISTRVTGLLIAFGGPALLLSPAHRLLGAPRQIATKVFEQLVLWILLAIIIAIVVVWEKEPLTSMWVQPFRLRSLVWGLLLAAVTISVIMPMLNLALHQAGIPAFERGMAKILILPAWFRVLAVITAGVVEDSLFLGYGFTRLALLARNRWVAGMLTVTIVSLLHLPNWGIGPVLAYLVAVSVAVAFFVWRRDLLANIVAHVTVDAFGLVIIPFFSHR